MATPNMTMLGEAILGAGTLALIPMLRVSPKMVPTMLEPNFGPG